MKALFIFSCIAFQLTTFAQSARKNNDEKNNLTYGDAAARSDSAALDHLKTAVIGKLEIPKTGTGDMVVTHTGYSFLYNETHEQAAWVAYELTKKETANLFERTDRFLEDPEVKSKTANDQDYAGSGYDRGHLAPAADMGWSEITVAESFYYSNMSPQNPSFNRGIWKKTEELVRQWAIENNSIYIVTGPVLANGLKTIGKNGVSVPEYYYKVILDYSSPSVKGIGFIMPNASSRNSPVSFAVSIDSIEKVTGIDFFPSLPDEQEIVIEKTLCIDCWTWNATKVSEAEKHEETTVEDRRAASVQCSGKTQSKKRCKRMTKSPNGLCAQHGGD